MPWQFNVTHRPLTVHSPLIDVDESLTLSQTSAAVSFVVLIVVACVSRKRVEYFTEFVQRLHSVTVSCKLSISMV